MVTFVRMPAVNTNETDARLIRWKSGTKSEITPGSAICEIETSKATIEVEAQLAGFLIHYANVGDRLPVGSVLGAIVPTIDSEIEWPRSVILSSKQWTKKAEVTAARLGISISEMQVNNGDKITEADVLEFAKRGRRNEF